MQQSSHVLFLLMPKQAHSATPAALWCCHAPPDVAGVPVCRSTGTIVLPVCILPVITSYPSHVPVQAGSLHLLLVDMGHPRQLNTTNGSMEAVLAPEERKAAYFISLLGQQPQLLQCLLLQPNLQNTFQSIAAPIPWALLRSRVLRPALTLGMGASLDIQTL
mmetsp:Transcript_1454/g.2473  ORF Transcript_1454/g.2473 Transcript_1454/m.2473 type:complete len:162 (-) Transcript_1454:122-607(-)